MVSANLAGARSSTVVEDLGILFIVGSGGIRTVTPVKSRASIWNCHAIKIIELVIIRASFMSGRQRQPRVGSRWCLGRIEGGRVWLIGHLALLVGEWEVKFFPKFWFPNLVKCSKKSGIALTS